MWESTPYVKLTLQPTVPLSCSGCRAIIRLGDHVGLTASTCSLEFVADSDPATANRSLQMRAVQTPGTNSRIVKLSFLPVVSDGRQWNGYRLPDVSVSYRK